MNGIVINPGSAGGIESASLQQMNTQLQQLTQQSQQLFSILATTQEHLERVDSDVDSLISSVTCTISERVWRMTESGAVARLPIPEVTADHQPHVIVAEGDAETAMDAGMELLCETGDGVLAIYADDIPQKDIAVSITLIRQTQPISVAWPVGINVDPKTYTWADWKDIVESGETNTYIRPGDATRLTPLNGTMGGVEFDDYNVRFRVMHIDNEDRPIFMLWENEDGVPVGLAGANYGQYIEADGTGTCMNRKGQIGLQEPDASLPGGEQNKGTNRGGWEQSYDRLATMPEAKLLLPSDLQGFIIPTTLWTDNVGGGTDDASNITQTTDELFIADEFEIFGINSKGNTHCSEHQVWWEWLRHGISPRAARHDNGLFAECFMRGASKTSGTAFCVVGQRGTASAYDAANSYILRFCFRI